MAVFVRNWPVVIWIMFANSLVTKTVISAEYNSTKDIGGLHANATTNENDVTPSEVQFNSSPISKAFRDLEKYVLENLNPQNDENIESRQSINNLLFGVFNALDILDKIQLDNGSTCSNDVRRLIAGLLTKDTWAVQFLDATGKPGPSLTRGRLNFVGNYDQCTSATAPSEGNVYGFHGGYFSVALKSPSIPILIQIGVCMPDACSEEEITTLGREVINKVANGSLSVASVHHLTNSTEVTPATIVAIVVSCVIGLMMILGTAYDFVYVQFPLWYGTDKDKNNKTDDLQNRNFLNEEQLTKTDPETKSKSMGSKILMAFSMYSNSKKVLDTSQGPGCIESIHGIRFFSITWVILAHILAFSPFYSVNAASAYSTFLNRWTFDVIANSFTCVDTFFTLSGLLTSYLTMGHLLKKGLKLNWPLFYFHRFWRLTPPYMLVLLFYLGFQQYFIEGTLRNFEQPIDKSACEKHWWTNLLYINNLIHTKQGEICLGHTWYMSIDMQFFILSPLLMIPFYFHRLAGMCSCLVFLLGSWIITGVLSSLEEWPPTAPNLKQALRGEQNDAWLNDYYVKPWCRVGPFVVGIVAGYVLSIHKERQLYLKWWMVTLGWIAAAASAIAVVYGLRGDITGNDPSSIGVSALYNSVARSVWGACVSWVIIACATGYGGPVNVLLSWSPFVVLGRLSYMVYLIHVPIVFAFYQNMDQLFYINDTTVVIYFLGLLVVSNLLAFVFMLALESPMIGLEKAILRRGKH